MGIFLTALLNGLRWLFVGVFGAALTRILTKYGPAIIALGFIITAIVSVLTLYLNTMFSVVESIHQTIPQTALNVWGWVMPSNAIPCLLALLTARFFAWVTKVGYDLLKVKAKAVSS
ncbi:MAG: minor coat protein [Ignavibacteriales bacterium]|nr:minor coat protein [Ignavibacteriales bacterium]